ncbi:MAG TPA: FHA domain-containing protein [Lysobacter sp.]
MQARLIAYPPDDAALPRWLAPGDRLRIGRTAECDLVIDDPSVSRLHAELVHDDGAWRLRDLGSKNGCFVDGMITHGQALPSNCWIRLGDVHCEFAQFEPAQADAIRSREQQRRARSAVLTQQVAAAPRFESLLDDVLQGVLELSGCSRGFLLLARDGDYLVRASAGLGLPAPSRDEFTGSVGAVERTLAGRRPVVVNQVENEPWLSGRASVIGGGLRSLVCLPLLDRDKVLGAVYADRRGHGEPITEVDLELLQAFAETATLWLLAGRAIDSIDGAPRWSTLVRERAGGGGGA